jgi:Protein of unknown function (DUF3108)
MRMTPAHAACLLIAASLLSTPLMAAEGLTPHSAEYKVKISVLRGKLTTRLQRTDTGYEATHRIVPTGLARLLAGGSIEETSRFDSAADGVLPTHYISSDTLSKDKTSADILFEWSTGAVNGTVNGEVVDEILDGLAHDRVSIQYELMRDLMTGGASETYILYDIDRLKTLNVRLIDAREVKVPAGRFTVIGVQHQAEGSSRITTLWCAEELDYLPVIIEQHRKGKLRLKAELSRYEPETT